MAEGEQPAEELTPEELLEHIRRMKVSDLLLSTISTVAQLGYAKLDPAGRDLEQAKLAIDSLTALVPVLEGSVPEDVLRDFNQVAANLKLAYAKAAAEGQPEPPVREGGPGEGAPGEPGGSRGPDERQGG
ncbi:MAG TPA: hypothetical protein VFT86_03690 [Gaiellaceae bacterium]|nr:hypothetical protein [Gaiellaceae bacterium]